MMMSMYTVSLFVVGLGEQQAMVPANGDVLVFTSSFTPKKNKISRRQEKIVTKVVVDSETDKVLGASMCGPDAPETMQSHRVLLLLSSVEPLKHNLTAQVHSGNPSFSC